MNLRSLPAILRTLVPEESFEDDAELLRRFGEERSEIAFAALVRRHGRLVWTVCRNLTGSDTDADDAFQATFVVLLKNAKSIRDPARLSPWLHGVAFKVCTKTRQSQQLRTKREESTAQRECAAPAVPESAWDRTLAAVHEEVAAMPESLRVPFVMCCLEGQGVTEAAAKLGWKLGTLSGRLTRAKDMILARLETRGMALGAIASIGLAIPPVSSVAKAAGLIRASIPNTILELTQGVTVMKMNSVKLLAAAVLVACGLGTTFGTGFFANAQTPGQKSSERAEEKRKPSKANAVSDVSELWQLGLEQSSNNSAAEILFNVIENQKPGPTFQTKKWQYDLVEVIEMGTTKFASLLQDYENRGWDYHGTTQLTHDKKMMWVFRKPVLEATSLNTIFVPAERFTQLGLQADDVRSFRDARYSLDFTSNLRQSDVEMKKKAEIRKLERQIAELKGRTNFYRDELSIDSDAVAKLFPKLIENKFKSKPCAIHPLEDGFSLEAAPEVRDWAKEFINQLIKK